MPSNRKKARRAIRAFLKNLSEKNPDTPTDQQGVWACGAALYSEDLRTLLDSERVARAEIQTLQCKYTAALKALSGRARRASEQEDENRKLTAERDRWQRTAEAHVRNLAAERDSLRRALNNLSAEDVRKIAQDLLPQFLETFFKGGKK